MGTIQYGGEISGSRRDDFVREKVILLDAYKPPKLTNTQDSLLALERMMLYDLILPTGGDSRLSVRIKQSLPTAATIRVTVGVPGSRIEKRGEAISEREDMRTVNRFEHEVVIEVGSGIYRLKVDN